MQFSTFVGGGGEEGGKDLYLSIRVINVFRSFEAYVMRRGEIAYNSL